MLIREFGHFNIHMLIMFFNNFEEIFLKSTSCQTYSMSHIPFWFSMTNNHFSQTQNMATLTFICDHIFLKIQRQCFVWSWSSITNFISTTFTSLLKSFLCADFHAILNSYVRPSQQQWFVRSGPSYPVNDLNFRLFCPII